MEDTQSADHAAWGGGHMNQRNCGDRFMQRAFLLILIREQVERFMRGEALINMVKGEY